MKTKYITENIRDLIYGFNNKTINVDTNGYISNDKVIYLLDCISKGYPVNSISINKANNTVVSGKYILIVLLRCFAYPSFLLDIANFNIYYDLIQKAFVVTEKQNDTQIALYSLIHTRDFFDWQRKMGSEDNFELMLNEYDRISSVFSKYDIQVIELIGASEEDIKAIKAILG
jgi:hypothetical protein